jgi:hypothetical protein
LGAEVLPHNVAAGFAEPCREHRILDELVERGRRTCTVADWHQQAVDSVGDDLL